MLDASGARSSNHTSPRSLPCTSRRPASSATWPSRSFAEDLLSAGGRIQRDTEVLHPDRRAYAVRTDKGDVSADHVIACAGLQSDRVAAASGTEPGRIVAFGRRVLRAHPEGVRSGAGPHLPGTRPDFPFLGVHLTRGFDGSVHAGPNAVLALTCEGYRWSDVSLAEIVSPGSTPRLPPARPTPCGAGSRRDAPIAVEAAVRARAQRLVPEIQSRDLVRSPPGHLPRHFPTTATSWMTSSSPRPTGPQAGCAARVERAPSPAATSSLEIGAETGRRLTLSDPVTRPLTQRIPSIPNPGPNTREGGGDQRHRRTTQVPARGHGHHRRLILPPPHRGRVRSHGGPGVEISARRCAAAGEATNHRVTNKPSDTRALEQRFWGLTGPRQWHPRPRHSRYRCRDPVTRDDPSIPSGSWPPILNSRQTPPHRCCGWPPGGTQPSPCTDTIRWATARPTGHPCWGPPPSSPSAGRTACSSSGATSSRSIRRLREARRPGVTARTQLPCSTLHRPSAVLRPRHCSEPAARAHPRSRPSRTLRRRLPADLRDERSQDQR